jgi:prepilin-type N-terminal cleavage/methylation domain-containing protein
MKNIRLQGFTLLELSIVLLIIGVITGGILYGKSLLATSRLQTVITDVDAYTSAVNSFKQQYLALPGDMSTAETQWGSATSCPPGSGTTGTCNGNGDGKIGGVTSQEYETFRFWQQLYNAKLMPQSLSGMAGSGGVYDSKTGINVPASEVKGGGFSVIWWGTVAAGDANIFAGYYGNIFQFGANSTGNLTQAPIITPEQAASIDAKIDDGFPATGKVRAYMLDSTINPGCTTTDVVTNAVYSVSNSQILCSLIFVMGF